jgi:nucleoid DNA-binding protein
MHQGTARSKGSGWNAEMKRTVMTQSKLIAILMEKENLINMRQRPLSVVFTEFKRALQTGDRIEIRFGVFTMRNYAIQARNPKSGKKIDVQKLPTSRWKRI